MKFSAWWVLAAGYGEKVVLDQQAITRKPSRTDHAHAGAIPLAGQTAWQGLFRHGQLKSGQSVLIHGGSGGVGHFAIQFAKAKGARVLTTVSTNNLEFARSLGADVVIDYQSQRFEEHARELDMVFDLIDGDTRERSWKLLKRGGVLVTTLTEPLTRDRSPVWRARVTVHGRSQWQRARRNYRSSRVGQSEAARAKNISARTGIGRHGGSRARRIGRKDRAVDGVDMDRSNLLHE